jgi:hypothetical protein
VRISAWGEFMVGIGVTAVVLLALNSTAGDWQPMLRFVVAVGIASGVAIVVRRVVDSEGRRPS